MSIDEKAFEAAAKRWHAVLLGEHALPWEQCGDHWRADCLKQTRLTIEAYEAAKAGQPARECYPVKMPTLSVFPDRKTAEGFSGLETLHQPVELPTPKCPDGGCSGVCSYCYGFYEGQESCAPFMRATKRESVAEDDLIDIAQRAIAWCQYPEKKQVLMDVCRNLLQRFDVQRRHP